jgi:hypothetical protein
MYGGMPYLLSLERDEDKFQYLSGLFEEIYFKDILLWQIKLDKSENLCYN